MQDPYDHYQYLKGNYSDSLFFAPVSSADVEEIILYFIPPFLYFIPPTCQVREIGEGRVKPPESLNIGVFNMRGCSKNEVKKGEIGKMFFQMEVGCMCSKRD